MTPSDPAGLMAIGQVAARVGVATSAVRFYERQGLLDADSRVSGQRRYSEASLRRLVFIRMLQDAGLSLDDIGGIINATTNDEWKTIGFERLAALDDELARLIHARTILEATLLCRFDHPLTDCMVMAGEIDRRLDLGEQTSRPTDVAETD